MASPTWLAAADKDPTLESKPVGTGPFVFKDYKPGESFTATKNPNYWNKPYPYLDEVEFRVIPDALTRASALEAGDVELIHTTNGDTIKKFRGEADKFPMTEVTDVRRDGLHAAERRRPGELTARPTRECAARWRTRPTTRRSSTRSMPASTKVANGPFSPAQVGYLDDSGFPLKQDMAKAQELVASYKADHPGPLNISLSTTQDATEPGHRPGPAGVLQAGRLRRRADQPDRAGEVHPHGAAGRLPGVPVAQPRRATTSTPSTSGGLVRNALPVGQLALNFGRIKDPVIDKALADNRGATDPATEEGCAETVNKEFATQCYNLWGSGTVWGLPHAPNVMDVGVFVNPDGSKQSPGTGGTFNVRSVWINPNA